jgi:single-strand DNA-binding protein
MSTFATFTAAGFLGRDPETTQAGENTKTTLCVPVSVYAGKDKEGNRLENTTWWYAQVWGKRGTQAAEHLAKGKPVIVTGTPNVRAWTDGEGKARFTAELLNADWSFAPVPKASSQGPAKGAGSEDAPF